MARKKKSSKKARKAQTLTEAKTENQSLLNENTIRRFQKLANVSILSEKDEPKKGSKDPEEHGVAKALKEPKGALKKVLEPTKPEEQEKTKEKLGLDEQEEMGLEDEELEMEDEELEMEDEELGMEEEGVVDEGTVEDLVSAIADAITDTTGIPVNVEGEGEEGLEDLEGLEGLEGEGEMMPPEEEMMQEAYDPQQLRNYLISEVTNRIRARAQHEQQQRALYEQKLQQQALYEHQVKQQAVAQQEVRKQQLAESLADRIFTRLKGKKQKK